MKRINHMIAVFLCLSIVLTIIPTNTAKQVGKPEDPFAKKRRDDLIASLPPEFRSKAQSPEAREAWNKLTPEQREIVKNAVHKSFSDAFKKVEAEKNKNFSKPRGLKDIFQGNRTAKEKDTSLLLSKGSGNRRVVFATELEASTLIAEPLPPLPRIRGNMQSGNTQFSPNLTMQCADSDNDGLTDCFESTLADAFTPYYVPSQYDTDHFASFYPFVPQTANELFGTTPFSYNRVKPYAYFLDTSTNQYYLALQIDYLSLWNHDSGLASEGNCEIAPGLTQLEGLRSHNLDNERSAALVAVPVAFYGDFNPDPYAYKAWAYFTAAHEDTVVDKSMIIYTNPVDAGWHVVLALSLSKHSTYTFDPSGLPLVPTSVMIGAWLGILFYCSYVWDDYFGLSEIFCLAAIYYAYSLFTQCAVEVWFPTPGAYAPMDRRINVGEPDIPSPPGVFIQDTGSDSKLYQKLTTPIPW